MLIGQVSELTGASRKAIRHYESIGLIPVPQRRGSYRVYNDHDVTIISMIRQAQSLGFSLAELRELVSIKAANKTFPIDLASELIDNKVVALEKEMASLLESKKGLESFKVELVKTFA